MQVLNTERKECSNLAKNPHCLGVPTVLKWVGEQKDRPLCPVCHVFEFFSSFLTHTKGRWAGVQFRLIPWQRELLAQAFGTLLPDGRRQYRFVYVEVPKKNGKTELGAGIALYGLIGDGEMGGEVYSAAGDKDQASLVYYPAMQMVRNNKKLAGKLKIIDSRKRIVHFDSNSFYQVLSSEVHTKHGLNPSVVIFDELHAQPSRELYDVLTEGTDIAREQQIIFIITTAGVADKHSIGWEIHEYARQVNDGIIEDKTFLPIMYGADQEKDDWTSKRVWKKANPSMGDKPEEHIFKIDNMETHYKQVVGNPARINNFLRYRLNIWTSQISRYIPMEYWDACDTKVDPDKLLKQPCFGGLDLSSTTDLTAFVLVFPPISGEKKQLWRIIPHFFVPEDNVIDRVRKDRVPYDLWIRSKLIKATPGNVIDYGFVRQVVNNAADIYDLREVAFDRWGASKLVTDLQEHDGIPMVQFGQGFKSMSAPTKELLKLVMEKSLAHGGHPVLRWNADNLSVKTDAAENVKPEKDKSTERIDGVVALIMGLSRAIVDFEKRSIYEERGVIAI